MFAGQRRGRPVFISYARATGTHGAVALHAALGGAAGLAFLDTSAIGPGDSIPLVVFESLLAARVLVVLIDATYFTRRYCMQELRVGLWAFQVLSERGGDRLGESLRPIVIGLPLDGAGPGVMDRLPPAARESNWPATADPHRLAALVRTRLADVETTIGEQGFIGRATELWRIHTALTLGNGPRGAALTGSLEGGGGFGKSRLAAEYLHRFGPANFPGGLFWIDADVPEDRVEAQLHGVLRTLHPGTPELSEFRRQGRDAGRELAGALSGHERRDPVLFVVDGVPEPEAGRPPRPLSTWCPAIGQVSTLVTSRFRRSLNGDIRSLPVAELSSEAAVALLTHEHGGRAAVSQGAWLRVADWVGHLPLALELLNAALRAGAVTAAELVAMAGRAGPAVELDRQMEALRGQVPAGSLRGVTEALLVSYERLSVPARCSARAMAALAPDPIPLALVMALGQEMMSRSVRADLTVRSLACAAARAITRASTRRCARR